MHVSDLIFKELRTNRVTLNRFTLVGCVVKKLKLDVNNKEDYAVLVATDKLPAKVNGIDIEVIKPKFTLDSFALVVRYVPRELDEDFFTYEIQRTIKSADRIKRIQ
jgi:spore germination protein GerM